MFFGFVFFFLFHNIKIRGRKESVSKSTFLFSIKAHRKFPKNESHSWFPSKNKEDKVQQFCYFVKVKKGKKTCRNILRFFFSLNENRTLIL